MEVCHSDGEAGAGGDCVCAGSGNAMHFLPNFATNLKLLYSKK